MSTGWADTWMISANAPNPNCMLKWMDHTLQPDVQAEVGIYYGAAGSNVESCQVIAETLGEGGEDLVDSVEYSFCGNEEFLDSTPPVEDAAGACGDDRGNELHRLLAVDAGLDRDPRYLGSPVASVTEAADGGAVRRLSAALYRHRSGTGSSAHAGAAPRVDGRHLPGLPGAVARLVLLAPGRVHGQIVHDWGFTNFQILWEGEVYRTSSFGRSGSPPRSR